MTFYLPEEDSYFLSEFVKEFTEKYKPKKILDMGSGSGIQAEISLKSGAKPENLTLADINKDAIKPLKKKFPKSEVVHSDLFQNIEKKFDLIIFNPPYLPTSKFDNKTDTTGGRKGSETINKFLKQAEKHLTKKGKILLLTSSFTKGIDFGRYKKNLSGREKLFFEELMVWNLFSP